VKYSNAVVKVTMEKMMNIKLVAILFPAAATIIVALIGKSHNSPSSQDTPIQVVTSGSNSPAIISSGNVTVQYGVPNVLLEKWAKNSSNNSISIEILTAKFLAIKSAIDSLSSFDNRALKLKMHVDSGDLLSANEEAIFLSKIFLVENRQAAESLVKVSNEIILLNSLSVVSNTPFNKFNTTPVPGASFSLGLKLDRQIMFASYRLSTGQYCNKPVFADTGKGVFSDLLSEGCETNPVGWVMGTERGLVRFFPTLNRCQEYRWNIANKNFDDVVVICPNDSN
jgi:hypothetical protein